MVSAAPERSTGRTLWGAEDFIRLVLSLGAGAIAVVVAWYVCSGDVSFNKQIGPLDIAVGGMVLAGLGNVMWLLRGRRALGERRRALLPEAAEDFVGSTGSRTVTATGSGAVGVASGAADAGLFVAGDGLLRFHRPGCALAEGRAWTHLTRPQHEAAGRQACGVCQP